MLAGLTEASILQVGTVLDVWQCQIIGCAMSGNSLVAAAHACQVLSWLGDVKPLRAGSSATPSDDPLSQ